MRGLVATAAISAGLVVLIAIMLIAGGALELAGVKSLGVFRWPIAVTFFGLILAFAFSAIPLMLKLVLAVQVWLGNAGVPPIKAAIEHQRVIVAAIWALMALGCAVAIPAAILDGFGTGGSPLRDAVAHLPSQGTLVTAPGLTIRQTIDASSLKLALGSKSAPFSRAQLGGAAIFDFRVAGTGLRYSNRANKRWDFARRYLARRRRKTRRRAARQTDPRRVACGSRGVPNRRGSPPARRLDARPAGAFVAQTGDCPRYRAKSRRRPGHRRRSGNGRALDPVCRPAQTRGLSADRALRLRAPAPIDVATVAGGKEAAPYASGAAPVIVRLC
jgi:hypothetical protein